MLSLAEFVTEMEELWCNYCLSETISIQMFEKVRLLRVLTFYPLDTLDASGTPYVSSRLWRGAAFYKFPQ